MGFISDLIKGDQEDGSEDINVEVKSNGNNKEFKNKTILVEPRAFSEAQQIADHLKKNLSLQTILTFDFFMAPGVLMTFKKQLKQQIADYLKARNQVVVNFKRVTSDVSKRIMDFLNGIIYAIDGTMEKLGPGIVLCAPKGFEIEGNISEEDTKKGSKKE